MEDILKSLTSSTITAISLEIHYIKTISSLTGKSENVIQNELNEIKADVRKGIIEETEKLQKNVK